MTEGEARSRGFFEFPPDWDELSREDQLAVARGMAVELQRQTGITPKPMGTEVPGESGDDPDGVRREK